MAIALDAVDANQTLSFEMSEESIKWSPPARSNVQGLYPAFYVGVAIKGAQGDGLDNFVPRGGSSKSQFLFLSFTKSRMFSEQQKALLQRRQAGLTLESHLYVGQDGVDHTQKLLLAVSVEDAKRMAQAYLDFAKKGYDDWRSRQEEEMKKIRGRVAEYESELPLLIAEAKGLQTNTTP